jgi:hypothetical protein
MANICTNLLYLSTGDRKLHDDTVDTVRKTFKCNDVHSFGDDVFECEINFDSRWTFPHQEMEKLTEKLPEGNDLYVRVISYEFGCEYVGFNIYTSGEWCDKFAG